MGYKSMTKEDLMTIAIFLIGIAVFAVIVAIIWLIIEIIYKYKDKKYQNLFTKYPLLDEKTSTYFEADKKFSKEWRKLYDTKESLKELRKQIPISLPEEKEELYKEIHYHIEKIKLLEESYEDSRIKSLSAENAVIDCAKEMLNGKELKIFCKRGGWRTNEKDAD